MWTKIHINPPGDSNGWSAPFDSVTCFYVTHLVTMVIAEESDPEEVSEAVSLVLLLREYVFSALLLQN